jgi:hypothetical protein
MALTFRGAIEELGRWLKPFLGCLDHKPRRRILDGEARGGISFIQKVLAEQVRIVFPGERGP